MRRTPWRTKTKEADQAQKPIGKPSRGEIGPISRADRRRALGEEVAGATGRVIRIGDGAGGRASGAGRAVVGGFEGGLFLRTQVMFRKATVAADMPLVAGSVLAVPTLACAVLTAARRADAALTGAVFTRAVLAGAILTRTVLARTAACMPGLMGIRAIEVGEEEAIDDRTAAGHAEHGDQQSETGGAFHGRGFPRGREGRRHTAAGLHHDHQGYRSCRPHQLKKLCGREARQDERDRMSKPQGRGVGAVSA